MSTSDGRHDANMIGTGFLCFVGFTAWTVYLVSDGWNWWSLGTGFIAFVGLDMMTGQALSRGMERLGVGDMDQRGTEGKTPFTGLVAESPGFSKCPRCGLLDVRRTRCSCGYETEANAAKGPGRPIDSQPTTSSAAGVPDTHAAGSDHQRRDIEATSTGPSLASWPCPFCSFHGVIETSSEYFLKGGRSILCEGCKRFYTYGDDAPVSVEKSTPALTKPNPPVSDDQCEICKKSTLLAERD